MSQRDPLKRTSFEHWMRVWINDTILLVSLHHFRSLFWLFWIKMWMQKCQWNFHCYIVLVNAMNQYITHTNTHTQSLFLSLNQSINQSIKYIRLHINFVFLLAEISNLVCFWLVFFVESSPFLVDRDLSLCSRLLSSKMDLWRHGNFFRRKNIGTLGTWYFCLQCSNLYCHQ